ncbi:hypothetical protein VZQ01_19260 [Myxococcus faecalis]|jgi:hypothetical protein|uniref:hypothetical protein n=1 Tax=Myxococcus TaxID=32 RepID=UPI001CBD86B3|nr:hypothetical protein [Myxococcus sp. AS-1-15]MBZ4399231.1 hypothetical protein [Myxococcus sp. AS-1-15]
MLNLMKRLAGTFVLMMAVGCGPMDPAEETAAPEPSPSADAPTVEAAGLPEFLACLNPATEQARACIVTCVEFSPVLSLVPCLGSCGLQLTAITTCLPALAL